MVLFKDLNKLSTDLLTRDFTHEKPWEVEFKHRAKNPVFTVNAFVNDGNTLDALSSVKYTSPSFSLEGKTGTSASITDMQYRLPQVPGLTLGFRYDRKTSINSNKLPLDSGEVSAEYINGVSGPHVRFGLNPVLANWNLSATTGYLLAPNWIARAGTDISGTTDVRNLKYSFGAALSQTSKDLTWTGALKSSPADGHVLGKVVASVHAKANTLGAAEYGAEIAHALQTSKTQIAFGGLWYLDQPMGGGKSNMMLKMKMTQDAKVAMSITNKFSDSLTATFGLQVDATPKSTESVKYGVKFNLLA